MCLYSADPIEAQDRLAAVINKMFPHISNRQFAYGLVVTEGKVTAYMFDHIGVLESNPLPYLEMTDTFAALIIGLASDAPRSGLDETIFLGMEGQQLRPVISTMENGRQVEYFFTQKLAYFPRLPAIIWCVSLRISLRAVTSSRIHWF